MPRKFPIEFQSFQWKCPFQNEIGHAISERKKIPGLQLKSAGLLQLPQHGYAALVPLNCPLPLSTVRSSILLNPRLDIGIEGSKAVFPLDFFFRGHAESYRDWIRCSSTVRSHLDLNSTTEQLTRSPKLADRHISGALCTVTFDLSRIRLLLVCTD